MNRFNTMLPFELENDEGRTKMSFSIRMRKCV